MIIVTILLHRNKTVESYGKKCYNTAVFRDRLSYSKVLSMNEDLLKIKELEALRAQHRDLDNQINAGGMDEFTTRRLKQVKLALRDKIASLEAFIYPDIIA